MVVREILDELTAIEKCIGAAMKHAGLGEHQEAYSRLQSVLRRASRTKLRIKACCQPLPIAAQYTPKGKAA